MADKAIISEGFGKPPVDEQIEILSKQRDPETGKRLFTNFTGTSMNVYIDRKRWKYQKQADPKWTKTAIHQAGPHDRFHVAHPSVFATGQQAVLELLNEFAAKGAAAVVNCWPTRDGLPPEVVPLGDPRAKAMLNFITEASVAPRQAKVKAMNEARAGRRGQGAGGGRKAKYTDAQVRQVKALYASFQGTIKAFELAAGKLLGVERLPWRTVENWRAAAKRWPVFGSKPITMPRTPQRKEKARGRRK